MQRESSVSMHRWHMCSCAEAVISTSFLLCKCSTTSQYQERSLQSPWYSIQLLGQGNRIRMNFSLHRQSFILYLNSERSSESKLSHVVARNHKLSVAKQNLEEEEFEAEYLGIRYITKLNKGSQKKSMCRVNCGCISAVCWQVNGRFRVTV